MLAPGLAKLVQRGVYEPLAVSSAVVLAEMLPTACHKFRAVVEAHDNFISLHFVARHQGIRLDRFCCHVSVAFNCPAIPFGNDFAAGEALGPVGLYNRSLICEGPNALGFVSLSPVAFFERR